MSSNERGATARRILNLWPLWAGGGLLVALRLHAFELPLETDEANYAHIAARLFAGDRLYVDVWDHQPPGVFMLLAGAMALLGDAPHIFRWLATGASLVSLTLIFSIINRAAGRRSAIFGAFLFALGSSDPGTAGEGCNREIYMNTLILAGWYGALRAIAEQIPPRRAERWLIFSGSAFALGSLLKTILAIHWIAVGLWVFHVARKPSREVKLRTDHEPTNRPSSIGIRRSVKSLVWFGLPPLLVWFATFGYFAMTDRFNQFITAVFRFNLDYSSLNGGFWSRFLVFFAPGSEPFRQPFVFDSAWPLWIAAVLATPILLFGSSRALSRGQWSSSLLMLLAAYLATCLPAQFWPHYYYLMLPPAIVVVSLALRIIAGGHESWRGAPAISGAAGALLLTMVACSQFHHYWSQSPFGVTIGRYNGRDFWGRAQGENVRRVTRPDDQIFVYGVDAAIYYYAQRRCASRYTMITGLRSGYAGHAERRAIMLREIQERRPRLILIVLGEESFPTWSDFLPTRYDPVGYDFRDRPPHDPILMVLCDRERPIETIDWDWDRSAVGGWNLGEPH